MTDRPDQPPPGPPPVGVLVCTHGRPDFLGACLRSVLGPTPPGGSVVLVESGPVRSPLALGDDPRLRHLLVDRPGKSRQLNEGLRRMTEERVVLTDDDCR